MCPNFQSTWLSFLLFALTGTVLGSLGGGGSLLALPIFLLVLHVPMELAVPASAAVVGIAALFGAIEAWKQHRLDLSTLAKFALPGAVFAAAGAYLSPRIHGQILHGSLVALVAYSGIRLLSTRRSSPESPASPPRPARLAAAGAGTGLLMGLFGVGGGFLATPALILEGGLSAVAAIPIALGSIALSAAASLAVQIPAGTFRWTLVAPALVATLIGMEFAESLSRRIPQAWLQRGLGAMLLAAAASLLFPS